MSGACGTNVNWTYNLSTRTLTISGTGAMRNYYSDNRPWEIYEDSIKTVVIKDGVTSIGNYAFYSCNSLTSVTIPDSVTSIGGDAITDITAIPALTDTGTHTYGDWQVTFEPRFECEGEKQRICADCGNVETESIPALSTVIGDVNNDGVIDMEDYDIIVAISVLAYTPTEEELARADINQDGTVDSFDAIYLEAYLIGLLNDAVSVNVQMEAELPNETKNDWFHNASSFINKLKIITKRDFFESLFSCHL